MEERRLQVLDLIIFTLMLVISAGIGIFYSCRGDKQRTTNEFLMANRSMSVVPVAISILVSFVSAILVLGTPAEMYVNGTQYTLYVVGVVLAVIVANLIFVPLLYPLRLTSSFEYLEKRYKSRPARLTGTVIMAVQQVIYMGISSYAPSTALEAVTGFPVWATVLIIGVVATFYTAIGGMKAVVWTDVFQSFVMLAGLLAIVIRGVISVGSMSKVWKINEEWERIQFFDFNPDPTQRHSFWSLIVGSMVLWTGIYGCNQASVQRYCALPSLRKARISVLLNIIGMLALYLITCVAGIVVFAYYVKKDCDPLTSRQIGNSNQLVPYFVMEVLNVDGLPGLFISCLFGGALRPLSNDMFVLDCWMAFSSVSSSLNALAAITWEDFLKPSLGYRLTERQKTWVTKVLVVVYGGAGIGMALMAQGLGGTVLQASLSFSGAATGPLLGLFLMGGIFPWANGKGAVVGGILGLVLPMWISIGAYSLPKPPGGLAFPTNSCIPRNATVGVMATHLTTIGSSGINTTATPSHRYHFTGIEKLYTLSYLWYPSIGTGTAIVIGLLVSLITGPMSVDEVDPKYLIPIFDRLFCCLPKSWLAFLRCDKKYQDSKDVTHKQMLALNDVTPAADDVIKERLDLVGETNRETSNHGELCDLGSRSLEKTPPVSVLKIATDKEKSCG